MLCALPIPSHATNPPLRPLITSHSGTTASTGTVSASGSYSSSYGPTNAVTDNSAMWISAVYSTPAWLQYSFSGAPRLVRGYRLLFSNGSLTSRAPKVFDLQVLRGSTWETVDTRCCETNWSGYEERTFFLGTPVTASVFRVTFKDDNDNRSGVVVISIRRMQLL